MRLLPLLSSVSGGSTTKRPSTGKALSSMLKPSPSLCGNAAPMRVQSGASFVLRTAVNPFRYAVPATRKPWVAVTGHPSIACDRPLEAPGKTFCAIAVVQRAESQGFAIVQIPLDAYVSPLFRAVRKTNRALHLRWARRTRYSSLHRGKQKKGAQRPPRG